MKRLSLIVSLVFLLQLFNWPVLAQKSFLEAMFPGLFGDYLERRANPEETLQAPFAFDPKRKIVRGELPQNAAPLHLPHRNDKTIADWLEASTVFILAKNGQSYEGFTSRIDTYLSDAGLSQYQQFLSKAGLLQNYKSGQSQISAFVKEKPLLLNKAAAEGSYRWLFEVPVMVTTLPIGVESYKQAQGQTQTFKLIMQVGRVTEGGGEHGILIETWNIKK